MEVLFLLLLYTNGKMLHIYVCALLFLIYYMLQNIKNKKNFPYILWFYNVFGKSFQTIFSLLFPQLQQF